MSSRWGENDVPRGADYDSRFDRLAASGADVHGEANFVMGFRPATVLDAGCGTGRVAIELARRGVSVAGIDLDLPMLLAAQKKAPNLEWLQGDLDGFRLTDSGGALLRFDAVVAAGNVMIFVAPDTEGEVVQSMARHVGPGGHLITGFQLLRDRYSLDEYEEHCALAGLRRTGRFSSWAGDAWAPDSGYLVSVHRAPGGVPSSDAAERPDQLISPSDPEAN